MQIPFTTEQFLDVIKFYNQAFFPLQIVFYIVAFYCVYLLFKPAAGKQKVLFGTLSFFWLWMGIAYHLVYFTVINSAAWFFGFLFIIQGILFAWFAFAKKEITFKYEKNAAGITAIIFILYALIIYPVLGHLLGHQYPYLPTFGLPCPTTIFTFGILLFAKNRVPLYLLIIPLLWSLIGFSAALNFTIYEDTGLLIAGVLGTILLIIKNMRLKKQQQVAV